MEYFALLYLFVYEEMFKSVFWWHDLLLGGSSWNNGATELVNGLL